MVDKYTLGQTGIGFSGKLEEQTNPYDPKKNSLNLTGYSELYVRFFRPDGTTFKKDAEPVDSSKLTDTEIIYRVSTSDILDKKGDWAYTVGAEYTTGIKIESTKKLLFWVI